MHHYYIPDPVIILTTVPLKYFQSQNITHTFNTMLWKSCNEYFSRELQYITLIRRSNILLTKLWEMMCLYSTSKTVTKIVQVISFIYCSWALVMIIITRVNIMMTAEISIRILRKEILTWYSGLLTGNPSGSVENLFNEAAPPACSNDEPSQTSNGDGTRTGHHVLLICYIVHCGCWHTSTIIS